MNSLVTVWANGIVLYLLATSLTAFVAIPAVCALFRVARVKTAVYRHMIWLYVLMGIAVVPAAWLIAPELPLAMLPARTGQPDAVSPLPSGATVTTVPVPILPVPFDTAAPVSDVRRTPVETGQTRQAIQRNTLLAGVWLAGVIVMLVRLSVSWCRLHRISRQATPASRDERLTSSRLRTQDVFISSQVDSPVCLGVFRPAVLLPEAMVTSCPITELQMILHHELAHIERRDCWINLFQCLMKVVYFFHPAIWYASHRLTQEREQICDNHVLAQGVAAEDYVELLHRIARHNHRQRHLQSVALFEGRLLARVRSLLSPGHTLQITSSWAARAVCLTVLLVCGILGTIRLQARPARASAEYRALSVTVQDANGSPVANAAVEALADYRPIAHSHTDISGRATLEVPQDAGVAWIIALKSGVGFDYYENYDNFYEPADGLPERVTLELDGARAVNIKAIDTAGKPLANVPFVPWTIIKEDRNWHVNLSGSDIAHVSTNSRGVAQFDWFPKHTSEDIHKEGSPRPGTTFVVQGSEYIWPVEMTKPYRDYNEVITARLLRCTAIEGRVLLPNGQGASDILVRAEGRGDTLFFCRREVRTDADGSYRLSVYPNQTYMVTVSDKTWASHAQNSVSVTENKPVENIDLHLREGTVIHGRVTCDPNNAHVAGQLVFLLQHGPDLAGSFQMKHEQMMYSRTEGLRYTTHTDKSGHYAFRVGPGKYTLGTLDMVDHDSNSEELFKLDILEQSRVQQDLHSQLQERLRSTTPGLKIAHQGFVCDPTMVVRGCDYCHLPHNRKPKPPSPVAAAPPLLGKPLPPWAGVGLDPGPDPSSRVVICFCDINQEMSQDWIAQLTQQAEQLKQKGVTVLAVQAALVDKDRLKDWVRQNNVPFSVGSIQGSLEETRIQWGVRSLPWLIVADREHVVSANGVPIQLLHGWL